jgi:uncharacterized protein (TIGR02145 family)
LKRILDDEKQIFVINEIKNQDLIIKIESLELFKKSSLNLLQTEKKRFVDELNLKNNKLSFLKQELSNYSSNNKNNSQSDKISYQIVSIYSHDSSENSNNLNNNNFIKSKNPFGSGGDGGGDGDFVGNDFGYDRDRSDNNFVHEKDDVRIKNISAQKLNNNNNTKESYQLQTNLNSVSDFKKSKKEIIKILKTQVDSLILLLQNKHFTNIELINNKKKLNEHISSLEKENDNLIDKLENQFDSINKEIKNKQDSIESLQSEINLIKHGPIKSIKIGGQVWMLENLNVSTFKNGEEIPEIKSAEAWKKAGENLQAAWCYYDNNPNNDLKYGKLYNWYAVINTNGLCPKGWHVPSEAEWDTLITYLGGETSARSKMKAKPIMKQVVNYYEEGGYYDTKTCRNCIVASNEYKKICPVCRGMGEVKTNKYIPVTKRKYISELKIGGWDGDNESGFTGLPGGRREHNGDFSGVDNTSNWWSSSDYNINNAKKHNIGNDYYYSNKKDNEKIGGLSVRCLKGDVKSFENKKNYSEHKYKLDLLLSRPNFDKGYGAGSGNGNGNGNGKAREKRKIENGPDQINSDKEGIIYLQVTINADGDVIKVINLNSETTITDQRVINQVVLNVKSKVKYNKMPGTTPQTQTLKLIVRRI